MMMRGSIVLLLAVAGLSACGRPAEQASDKASAAPSVAAPARIEPAAAPEAPAQTPPVRKAVSACLVQDGAPLDVKPLRAIGTEPFWGARIEGRCVTYSHPDDQKGTRVWTHYSAKGAARTWTGALGGKPFVLSVRSEPGCSDGMSDNVYPLAVDLEVGGEQRRGCASPL